MFSFLGPVRSPQLLHRGGIAILALRSSIAGEQLRSAYGHGNRGACFQNLTPGRTFTAQQVLFKD